MVGPCSTQQAWLTLCQGLVKSSSSGIEDANWSEEGLRSWSIVGHQQCTAAETE